MITSIVSRHYDNPLVPVICSLGLKNQQLIHHSLNFGLIHEAKRLQQVDKHLVWLLCKETGFDFVTEVARGRTLLVGDGNLSFALSLAEKPQITTQQACCQHV